MNIKEKAKIFAIKAHMGQYRKSELDKPMIIHPIGVAMLLEEYGFDENVVAAGYLHDVVEDTNYTIEDIVNEFGKDIARLVESATEIDKSYSWEERKKHTIKVIKTLPLENKAVICADKINNLEDLMLIFQKSGERDYSSFKRGEEQQKWYYTEVYKGLINNENENLPIFKRLKDAINAIFYEKEDIFLKDKIFRDNKKYYEELKKIHAQKVELQKLKAICPLTKPFVIEFTGTPRTGKTTTINNLNDFFKKGGFNISIIEEFTTSKYYKEGLKQKLQKLNSGKKHEEIIKYSYEQLIKKVNENYEILLVDRSINDRLIWNNIRYVLGDMDKETYNKLKEKYGDLSKQLIDYLVVTYSEPLEALKRDYHSSLALEKRSFLNEENIENYNNSLNNLKDYFNENIDDLIIIDTTNISLNDISIEIASNIMSAMRKKYIKSFKERYKIK